MARWKNSLRAISDTYDICFFGESGIGKSSMILHYIQGKYIEELDSSVEDIYTKIIPSGTGYKEYTILDTSAQVDYYASSRKNQIKNTLSLVFAYSNADRDSFDALEDIYQRVKAFREDMPPIILVGLKSDLTTERRVEFIEGQELAKRLCAINFTECSSKFSMGIEETFEPLIKEVDRIKLDQLSKEEASVDSDSPSSLGISSSEAIDISLSEEPNPTVDVLSLDETGLNSLVEVTSRTSATADSIQEVPRGNLEIQKQSTLSTDSRQTIRARSLEKSEKSTDYNSKCCIIT